MPLTLTQEQAISDLARCLYNFLPGQAHPFADQSISMQGAARALGLSNFWQGGSKQPATTALLRGALEHRAEKFCDLITEIVRKATAYRQNKSAPLTRQDIRSVNEIVQRIGFKIPELWSIDSFFAALNENEMAVMGDVVLRPLRGEDLLSSTTAEDLR